MSEIERRNPEDVVKPTGPLSEILNRVDVGKIDNPEVRELYAATKAHALELEARMGKELSGGVDEMEKKDLSLFRELHGEDIQ